MPRKRLSKKRTSYPDWIPYFEKLKDPRWQLLKAEIILRDKVCQECFLAEDTLHVHHKIYFRGREPWEYEPRFLITLCDGCHDQREEAILHLKLAIVDFTTTDFYDWVKRIKKEHESFLQVRNHIQTAAPMPPLPPVVFKNYDKTVWDKMREAIG